MDSFPTPCCFKISFTSGLLAHQQLQALGMPQAVYTLVAGVEGIEPSSFLLERNVLPLDYTPIGVILLLCFLFVNRVRAALVAIFGAFQLLPILFFQIPATMVVV